LLRYRKDGAVHFAGAHEELVVYRARQKRCETFPTPGVWAGILPVVPAGSVPGGSLQLEPGDVLLLYTDGVIEARNAQRGLFGMERLCASLIEVGEHPAEVICDHIVGQARGWATRQRDDLTLVVLRYQGAV
jgi:serine phosphatase RsbU (regulator of sigma subunit)